MRELTFDEMDLVSGGASGGTEVINQNINTITITAAPRNSFSGDFTILIPTFTGLSVGLGISLNSYFDVSIYAGVGVGAGVAVSPNTHEGDKLDGTINLGKGQAGASYGLWTQMTGREVLSPVDSIP